MSPNPLSALPALLLAASALAADKVAPSRANPGGFPVDRVPQFVCITSDDNYRPDSFKWFVDALKSRMNKSQAAPNAATFDGAPARMSFYVNSNNGGVSSVLNITSTTDAAMKRLIVNFKEALADKHEIGDHTKTHYPKPELASWTSEISAVLDALSRVGIDPMVVTGFRAPFLAYNDNMFKALTGIPQFRYDATIESGNDAATDGTNFVWPYTLDDGVFGPDLVNAPLGGQVGRHPGFWEVPVYCMIVPPRLRRQVWGHRVQLGKDTTYTAKFDTLTGKVVGMDYNMLSWPGNYGGLGLDSAEFAATLKHSLDLRLQGNRAPFTLTLHSNIFYDPEGWKDEGNAAYNGPDAKSPKATVAQARGAILDFLDYALAKPEVRVVTQENLVKWCAAPTAFAAPVGVSTGSLPPGRVRARFTAGRLRLEGLPAGTASVTLHALSGRVLARTAARGGSLSWDPGKLPPGTYLLRVRNDSGTAETAAIKL